PTARRAEEDHELAVDDLEVQVVDRRHVAEPLAHVLEGDAGHVVLLCGGPDLLRHRRWPGPRSRDGAVTREWTTGDVAMPGAHVAIAARTRLRWPERTPPLDSLRCPNRLPRRL